MCSGNSYSCFKKYDCRKLKKSGVCVVADRKTHPPESPFVIVPANAEQGNGLFYLLITPVISSYNLNLFKWFGLILCIPVNSYGHVGMVSSPSHTFFLGKFD